MTDNQIVNTHRSETLDYIDKEGLDAPTTAVECVDCPAGIWHRSQSEQLTCFCTYLHRDTWRSELQIEPNARRILPDPDPIMKCDGRKAAIAKHVRDQPEAYSR